MDRKFMFGKKAVSPVIGTILMVAVTVIMAAIVGGFVYQTARPKVPPAVSTSLADDPLVAVDTDDNAVRGGAATPVAAPHGGAVASTIGNRVAKLFFEGGTNIAIAELSALVTFTYDNGTTDTTVVLDGVYWDDAASGVGITAIGSPTGSRMAATASTSANLWLMWADNDRSGDITPGDRLDFYELDGDAAGSAVKKGTDFNVRILHKATQNFVADHTVRVY